jgi:hypothetical protein
MTERSKKVDGIAIGIIGPHAMMDKMEQVLKGFPSFVPVMKGYRHETEAIELAGSLMEQVEVILFTGPYAYRLAKDALHFTVPVHFIPLTGAGLYGALYRIRREVGSQSLSIDSLSEKDVARAFRELDEPTDGVVLYEGAKYPTREELIEFHLSEYRNGNSKAALTGLRSVSEALTAAEVPNVWLLPMEQDIISSLERALLSTESRKNKEMQTVVGFINVDDFASLAAKQTSEHDVQRLKLDIHRMIFNYVESLDGYLSYLGGEEYTFITTRGIFEKETGGYKYISLAQEMKTKFAVSLSIGIGFGRSANEAGTHARVALRRCKDSGGNICFIVREDRSMIGPLEMNEPVHYELSLIHTELLKKVEQAGVSPVYLSKLLAHVSRFGKSDYIAKDLATILGVTVRSTHRFLNSLEDAGLVEIIGEEKGDAKGRPKQIYRLNFVSDIIRGM